MTSILNKEQILAANDLDTVTVEVPEWGGSVLVKMMTGKERDAFEASLFSGKGKSRKQDLRNVRAKLACHVLVDENGNKLFNPKEIEILGDKSSSALDKIFEIAQEHNKISEEDLEEMAGNSEATQTE